MIFEALSEAAERGELLLWRGGFCRFHRRRDNTITILEILVLRAVRRFGIGTAMVRHLEQMGARAIQARCPADLPANEWYRRMGFQMLGQKTLKSGRKVNLWRKTLSD